MVKTVISNKPKIVIDASFWINVVYLDIESYLLKYFDIYFVQKVESEILNESEHKIYNTRDMDVYSKLKDIRLIKIREPKNIPKKLLDNLQYDSGELYCIALGIEDNMIVATDDKGPISFCKINNIPFMTSIDYILYLYNTKELTKKRCLILFNMLNKNISKKFIEIGKKYFK